ncbi:E2F transcription factor-like E2FE isoform X2 [Glycine soja]|uniref:E2F transcription factor-like E2FE isoform X2 n=1 Tax=Glycine max TaxID=3847 RepID=UPI0003DECC1F|nr:E2F transcription factor-like E2FE isoform X2 [Glycine max]XP_006578604.1 E2F transcription factor-like E2FE isoform X2 [Glycine max]XP_014630259.1 E2F transcription factor-like E2FE isoform X2 [Glycine max]XP_028229178.1 E2F transcription factor-like E2FE isoform X2 [Glycine soja]XP_028229179.1 E2F transcription factor-like E2FE isoform X2 [Glycine soja]|eukprot:XP_006578603.1 E2F transcription factor-like E2FE isoform X2 [Glycine max]
MFFCLRKNCTLYKNRREKSLALLTQNFVKLFVCSNFEMISLDEAAKLLLGNANNRTKVRRLYDIANVLSSMNLIEKVIFSSVHFKFPHRALQWKCCFLYSVLINYSKLMMSLRRLQTHTTNTRKPAFRWLGVRGKTWSESAQTNVKESQKRMFGSDITNINFKRKVDLSMDGQNFKTQNQQENISPRAQLEKKSLKKDAKQTSMSYQFGPFAPAYVHKVGTSENNSVKQVQDWESLAQEHRPQYQNQALKDLFSHYMEAWKSWYSEAAKTL